MDEQGLTRLHAQLPKDTERGPADGDQRGGGFPRQGFGLGHRPVEQGVFAVASADGGTEDLVPHGRIGSPGVTGNRAGTALAISPDRIFMSRGFTEAARTRIRTWPGPGSGVVTSVSRSTSGAPYSENVIALDIRNSLLEVGGEGSRTCSDSLCGHVDGLAAQAVRAG